MSLENIKRNVRGKLGVKERQMFAYHKYPLNFLRKLPDFLIIGSQKAATSTLHNCLAQHRNVLSSEVKELQFFNMNYSRGVAYYKSCFPIGGQGQQIFETTPDYIDHPRAAELCYKLLPNVKLIVVLRNPVDRAFSHFRFVQSYNKEEAQNTFEKGLELESSRMDKAFHLLETDRYNSARIFSNFGYKRKGEYVNHISEWLKYYSLENFHFIDYEDLSNDLNGVVKSACDFLGLPEHDKKYDDERKNVTSNKGSMSEKINEELREHYSLYNKKLYELLSRDFNW